MQLSESLKFRSFQTEVDEGLNLIRTVNIYDQNKYDEKDTRFMHCLMQLFHDYNNGKFHSDLGIWDIQTRHADDLQTDNDNDKQYNDDTEDNNDNEHHLDEQYYADTEDNNDNEHDNDNGHEQQNNISEQNTEGQDIEIDMDDNELECLIEKLNRENDKKFGFPPMENLLDYEYYDIGIYNSDNDSDYDGHLRSLLYVCPFKDEEKSKEKRLVLPQV